MASKTESLAGLEAKARALAEQMGYELVDVCMDKEPTGKYLRFYIDKEEASAWMTVKHSTKRYALRRTAWILTLWKYLPRE